MATGVDLNKSSIGSEEIFDKCCSPCSDSGRIKEGKQFCEECDYFFCDQCLKEHNKFPSLRSHRIVDKSTDRSSRGGEDTIVVDELSNRCVAHCGQIIDMFCKNHDEVCCKSCVVIKHRSCEGLDSIRNVAKGILNSKELKDTKENLTNVEGRIKTEKEKRNRNISNLDLSKIAIFKDIDKYQDDIIVRIKELAEASRKEVRAKHAELVQAIESDTKELDTILMLTEECSKKLNATKVNEVELFTNTKSGIKITGDVAEILDELSTHWKENILEYCFDNEFTDTTSSLKSLGRIADSIKNWQYEASICKKINVKQGKDIEKCDINGICILNDDTVIISDYRNKAMKRLDKNYKVTENLSLDGAPIAVCVVGKEEVAVAIRKEKKVQLVSCSETFRKGKSFDTDLVVTGLYFDINTCELYVSCGGLLWCSGDQQAKINVYKKNGTLLRTYGSHKEGSPLFSSPNNITMMYDVIYTADRENGLIAMNRNSDKLWTFTDEKLKGPWGLCVLPRNQLLVSGHDSGNIIQVGADGREVSELLGKSEGLKHPYAIIYHKTRSRLLVGCESDEISVYTLSRK